MELNLPKFASNSCSAFTDQEEGFYVTEFIYTGVKLEEEISVDISSFEGNVPKRYRVKSTILEKGKFIDELAVKIYIYQSTDLDCNCDTDSDNSLSEAKISMFYIISGYFNVNTEKNRKIGEVFFETSDD